MFQDNPSGEAPEVVWDYPGWDSKEFLVEMTRNSFFPDLHYFFHLGVVDENYYYQLDAALMIMSKGGITLDNLTRGRKYNNARIKDRYARALAEIHKIMNKPADKPGTITEHDIQGESLGG